MSEAAVLAIHEAQLAEHGGTPGVREMAMLLSALARPQSLAADGNPAPDAASLAAAYCSGIVRNHAFVAGNKRTGLVVALVFLRKNGYIVQPDQREAVTTLPALAAGSLAEAELAEWFRRSMRPFHRE